MVFEFLHIPQLGHVRSLLSDLCVGSWFRLKGMIFVVVVLMTISCDYFVHSHVCACATCLQCFDTVGWVAGMASSL